MLLIFLFKHFIALIVFIVTIFVEKLSKSSKVSLFQQFLASKK